MLREKTKNKFRELSNEENTKREYGRNRYHNMSEEKKQTKRISKNYCEAKKLKLKFFVFLFLHCIKLKKTLTFGEKCIKKNKFDMHKKPITIDSVNTKKQCYPVKNYTIRNILLDMRIIMMVLYHYTYDFIQ